MSEQAYPNIANELVKRIRALVPDNPHIMQMDNPSDLLKIDAFEYSDLAPSYFQVTWALTRAQTLEV